MDHQLKDATPKPRVLEKAEALEQGLVRQLYPDVLAPSFPPEELGRPWEDDHVPGCPLLLVATDDECDEALGCAIGEVYPMSGTTLLGYLAVKPSARGCGVGSALLREFLDRWQTEGALLLAELDDPRHHNAHVGFGDPWARIRFYKRFNLQALTAPYFQPGLDGLSRAYHLMLCAFCKPSPADGTEAVDGEQLQAFLREYFVGCEGQSALDDPELNWLLGFYRGLVELVPLGDLDRVPHPDWPSDGRA